MKISSNVTLLALAEVFVFVLGLYGVYLYAATIPVHHSIDSLGGEGLAPFFIGITLSVLWAIAYIIIMYSIWHWANKKNNVAITTATKKAVFLPVAYIIVVTLLFMIFTH